MLNSAILPCYVIFTRQSTLPVYSRAKKSDVLTNLPFTYLAYIFYSPKYCRYVMLRYVGISQVRRDSVTQSIVSKHGQFILLSLFFIPLQCSSLEEETRLCNGATQRCIFTLLKEYFLAASVCIL